MKATILVGDVLDRLRELPDESGQCVVTSPPYWGLRDYGVEGQLGLEKTPDEYIAKMVAVFHEVWRVLRDDGTLWLNIGDSYASDPGKGGSGTTGVVALRYHRDFVGIELNPTYAGLAQKRIGEESPMFNQVEVQQSAPIVR